MNNTIITDGRLFTLNTKEACYQFYIDQHGVASHLWFGPKTAQDMTYLQDYPWIGFAGQIYDAGHDYTYSHDTKQMEYPTEGCGDYRITAASAMGPQGEEVLDLRYHGYEIQDQALDIPGLPHLRDAEGIQTLDLILRDVNNTLEVHLCYTVYPEQNAIARAARFVNISRTTQVLQSAASLALDFYAQDLDLIHFHGHHNQERSFERVPILHGIQEISSKRGTSSHQHNPAVILAEPQANDTSGFCTGIMLMYSGSYAIKVEKDPMDQIRVVAGLPEQQFSWELKPGDSFWTPQCAAVFSDQGLDHLSHQFHDLIREHVIDPDFRHQPRPVLINNWEATYFDFTGPKILDIARKAADLGIDMLVLDDGWFGERNHDRQGLGDWIVNKRKLGGPLHELIGEINAMGLKFGLWFEPEMISEDSALYRTHPEWALQFPHRKPVRNRSQLVLDFSNPKVVDCLYQMMSSILANNPIDYVKWDMNRYLSDWYSPTLPAHRQKELPHRYMLGVYQLLQRLTDAFPHVLFEGCSGGGGRFDAGMLYYTPQFWTSDDTDAHERCFIQHGTSFFYPISTMGSHVSAVPNHQTGRMTSLEARSTVAMHGSFGYELDLNLLSSEEQEDVKAQTALYKELQPLIHNADYYRLAHPQQQDHSAWMFVSKDQRQVLVQGLIFETKPTTLLKRLRLKGLDPKGRYTLTMRNGQTASAPAIYEGQALMAGGILLPQTSGDNVPFMMMFEQQ